MSFLLHNLLLRDGVASAGTVSGAALLAAGYAQALALDFTDDSAWIKDTGTPANDLDLSSGLSLSSTLTYTAPSLKMTMGPSGTLRFQAHNLYLNSASPANQSITVVSGATYAVTITGSVSVTASGAATGTWTAGTNEFTAATTTLTLGSTSGSGTVHVRRTPSDSTYLATTSAARYALPLEWDSAGNALGLLVEEARTNLRTESNNFNSSGWAASAQTTKPSAATVTGPDGLTSGWRLSDNGTGGNTSVVMWTGLLTVSTSTQYTWSMFAKAGSRTWMAFRTTEFVTPGDVYTYFDLQNGVVGTTGAGHTAHIEDYGNGWHRCSITFTTDVADTQGRVNVYLAEADGDLSVPIDGTNYIYMYGAQFEAGAFPTSYIPTPSTSTVTRAADNISKATSGLPFSATTGAAMVEFNVPALANYQQPIAINDGSVNERLELYGAATGQFTYRVTDGGVNQAFFTLSGTYAAGTASKVAMAWAADDFAACLDGGTVSTDTSGTLPTVTRIDIGSRGGVEPIRGHIRKLLYVPERLADAALQTLTGA